MRRVRTFYSGTCGQIVPGSRSALRHRGSARPLSSSTPPLWDLLNGLAVWLGAALAGTLARQRDSQLN